MSGAIWEQFTHDPRLLENAHLRAGDRDRDVVHDALAAAYAEGRLTAEELEERTDQVARARTLGELPVLVADLVASTTVQPLVRDKRMEAERRYRQRRRQALFAFLVPTLICWVVWSSVLLTGEGTMFPWPAIVTVATSVGWLQLLVGKRDTIDAIERSLERKERKRLAAQQKRARRELPPPPQPLD